MPGIFYWKSRSQGITSTNQIGEDIQLNHTDIKTEIMFRERINTSVLDNEERIPESQNGPNSPKTVVRIFHPWEIKQTGLILGKPETLDIFEKVANYQEVSGKILGKKWRLGFSVTNNSLEI